MTAKRLKKIFPSWQNVLLALAAAGLLILAFPDFEWWWTAWFALVPLMWAIQRETQRGHSCPHEPAGRTSRDESTLSNTSRYSGQGCSGSFLLGWLFGTAFFFGTCWWLTYAPIHYAAMAWPLAYFLIFIVCLMAGLFPGIFAASLALLLGRFGTWTFLAAPFVWVFTEFARYWLTGNNWNAIGYSQAFYHTFFWITAGAGVLATSFFAVLISAVNVLVWKRHRQGKAVGTTIRTISLSVFIILANLVASRHYSPPIKRYIPDGSNNVIAIQPNVPASGLGQSEWEQLRDRQISLAEEGLQWSAGESELYEARTGRPQSMTVVLPESPMNFAYNDDLVFQRFIGDFASRNSVNVLFNSSEPDKSNGRYFNSAVMVGPDGRKAAEYDKIYLLPFGEAVPEPLENIVPAFVGHFSYGSKYDLMPIGHAQAGVMICFESHFGELGRRYVQNGADAIIEMTNDGYLGSTPVLRQHLANAVFRAVETNRPVLRVTNVGITAYIDERGNVLDPLPSYTEGTRVWSVSKSDGSQTFYVKYGDWFAWLCTLVTFGLLGYAVFRRRQ